MSLVFIVLYAVCPFATLFFIARLACALFSKKVSNQMSKHPVAHAIWACFALIGILVIVGDLSPASWPPPSVERRTQRQKVLERMQSVGGWAALQKDCDALVEQNRDGVFVWRRG